MGDDHLPSRGFQGREVLGMRGHGYGGGDVRGSDTGRGLSWQTHGGGGTRGESFRRGRLTLNGPILADLDGL